jgi:hypothetical protein
MVTMMMRGKKTLMVTMMMRGKKTLMVTMMMRGKKILMEEKRKTAMQGYLAILQTFQ